jgi:glyoxylase-like metal-dependent hydrolase (beta-lactamase superfamily II)
MQSWQIGAVKITRIVESEVPVTYNAKTALLPDATPDALKQVPWLTPRFVTTEGKLIFSIHALLIDAPGMRLIVDTCIGNDKPRRMTRGKGLQTPFLQTLADAGVTRESVDAVVCTHLHVDHVGWNTLREGDRWVPTFPRARYLMARREVEHWRADCASASGPRDPEQNDVMSDSVQPIFDAGLSELVEMDHVLSDEVRLVPTPGHTPGHVSVAVHSQGKSALITGDFVHHPCQLAHPAWSFVYDSDRDAAREQRQRMLAQLADSETLLIGTHFPTPTAGYLKRDGDAYRLESEMP